jgi:hypothetical protein
MSSGMWRRVFRYFTDIQEKSTSLGGGAFIRIVREFLPKWKKHTVEACQRCENIRSGSKAVFTLTWNHGLSLDVKMLRDREP